MDCTKCGLPIEGGQHGDNAIVVKYHWSDVFFESERATDVRHAVCVDDPLALPNVRNHLQCQGRSKTVPAGRSKSVPAGWCLTDPTDPGRGGAPALTTVRHWRPRGANRRTAGPTLAPRRRSACCL